MSDGLSFLITCCLASAIFGPRQTGRFIAKIVIGYRAQMRDEKESRL